MFFNNHVLLFSTLLQTPKTYRVCWGRTTQYLIKLTFPFDWLAKEWLMSSTNFLVLVFRCNRLGSCRYQEMLGKCTSSCLVACVEVLSQSRGDRNLVETIVE